MHKAKQFRAKLSSRRGMLCFCDSDRSREKLFSGKEEEEEICENMLVWGKTTSRHAKVYNGEAIQNISLFFSAGLPNQKMNANK